MIFFPVLQKLVEADEHSWHYFLIVLNLRNKSFELLDSMRSLEDEKLAARCNGFLAAIKSLWNDHYSDSKHPIDNYELVDIAVPKQTNNKDCRFHMIMHAQYWDGRSLSHFNENDMSNIRNILTYKWIKYEENDTAWETILNMKI
jgi:Ulp1 family protease